MRILFIGAGPASAMVLERLLASHRRDHPELRLDIRLVDPFPPGGGRIWRRSSPRC
ncbi:FAD/NAD(P)-binding protein [Leucobacter soli]|uniref:FAD/NAD(P)-binding protein n=1 Tax=Leucobacter soli TaxID=2812850 RepID=UPI0036206342